jgi:hypothetical protein
MTSTSKLAPGLPKPERAAALDATRMLCSFVRFDGVLIAKADFP